MARVLNGGQKKCPRTREYRFVGNVARSGLQKATTKNTNFVPLRKDEINEELSLVTAWFPQARASTCGVARAFCAIFAPLQCLAMRQCGGDRPTRPRAHGFEFFTNMSKTLVTLAGEQKPLLLLP